MPNKHGPMNTERVNNHLARIAAQQYCPGYHRWWMLKWTDWGLERLAGLLSTQGLKPDSHNAGQIALPILRQARLQSMAYINADQIQSPVTPNFRDVVDCVLGLSIENTKTLMRRMRRFGQDLADHCDAHGIGARAWVTDTDHARPSNPCFAMRLFVQGAVMHVRDGYGLNLLRDIHQPDFDPLRLLARALGPGQETERFVDGLASGTQGLYGNGKAIFSTEGSPRRRKSVRRRAVAAFN